MPDQIYLSKENIEKLKKQLGDLKNVKRKEIAERIQEAKDLGDLSENAEYSAAKGEQAFNEGKILELENNLRNAVMIVGDAPKDKISINSKIKVRLNEKEEEFTIVGDNDIDPVNKKISYRSPLGQSFLGKRAGDSGEVKIPKGIIKFKIITIA